MKRVTYVLPSAVFVAAVAMLAGCGESPSNVNNNPDSTQRTTSSTSPNPTPRTGDQAAANTPARSSNDDVRAADQARATKADGDAAKAGVKPSNPGVAKPIGVPSSATGVGDATDAATAQPRKVDNSGQNEVDKDAQSVTPMDQGNSEADIGITQGIRKALVADKALSVNAQNLKIITKDGVVVLRGPVASKTEADTVLEHVSHVNGVTRVENQIAAP